MATISEFRIYSGDMSAEQVAADYAVGTDALPSASPVLSINYSVGGLVLSWPVAATSYHIQTSTTLGNDAAWSALPGNPAPFLAMGVYQIVAPVANQTAFYRLTR
jgi:hypothetical protein